jgi:hypothetical protein
MVGDCGRLWVYRRVRLGRDSLVPLDHRVSVALLRRGAGGWQDRAALALEMPAAILLMIAAIYGMVRLAARIYAPAMVRGGGRLS